MATKTKKKPAKKKAAKPAAPSVAAELKAFRAAIQNLKDTGSALAKAVKANRKKLGLPPGVRSAVDSAINAAAAIAKKIPDPPTTTVFTGTPSPDGGD